MSSAVHLCTKRTGAVIVLSAPGGGAGTGDARFTMAMAARSSVSKPDVRVSETESTRPAVSILKMTTAIPVSPRARAAGGYFLRRSRCVANLPFHVATAVGDLAAPSREAFAAVRFAFLRLAAALVDAMVAGAGFCLTRFSIRRVESSGLATSGEGRCVGRGIAE